MLQVAFNLVLPCMLFTKVASTLANGFSWSLFVLPFIALIQVNEYSPKCEKNGWVHSKFYQLTLWMGVQVIVGALGGMLVNCFIDSNSLPRFGWHPTNPARSAKAIAMSTAAASGIPQAAPILLPSRQNAPPSGRSCPSD